MGRNNKVRKFAEMKRMIKARDGRLGKNQKKKQKQEVSKEWFYNVLINLIIGNYKLQGAKFSCSAKYFVWKLLLFVRRQ